MVIVKSPLNYVRVIGKLLREKICKMIFFFLTYNLLRRYNRRTYKMWEGLKDYFLSLSQALLPLA